MKVEPGDVIRVEEPDYMYGIGPLVLRVTETGRIQQAAGEEWINLKGYERWWDGSAGPERFALVRISGIRLGAPAREPRP